MDFRKTALYVAIAIVIVILWNAWQHEFLPQKAEPAAQTQTAPAATKAASASSVPTVPTAKTSTPTHAAPITTHDVKGLITIKTDVLKVLINPKGGNVVRAELLDYPAEKGSKQGKLLFNQQPTTRYIAQSGLTGKMGPDTQSGPVTYQVASQNFQLKSGQDSLKVNLHWKNSKGLSVTKQYVFTKDSFAIKTNFIVDNQTAKSWTGYVYTQLARVQPPKEHHGIAHYATFIGAAVSSPSEHYKKLKFKNFASEPLNQNAKDGWAAMIEQYFLSAWVPNKDAEYHYYTTAANGLYTVGMIGKAWTVAAGQQLSTSSTLYVGPAIASRLDKLSPHLSMTIDYGWLWFISKFIFWIMKLLHGIIGNWGWAIIFTTVIIKLIFYPLSDKSFRSMAAMRRLSPKMQSLKEKHEGDRAGLSRATMELYRKEKVNPLSGCLPIAIQIPVFIALYWVIIQSVEFRMAPWMLWIHDLSVHDPYYILPVIMGGLMFLQQRMSPPPPDPTQAKIMMFMPVLFTVFFLQFPSGLVLYWITNTLFTICHQFYVYRSEDKKFKAKKLKR